VPGFGIFRIVAEDCRVAPLGGCQIPAPVVGDSFCQRVIFTLPAIKNSPTSHKKKKNIKGLEHFPV